MVETVYQVNGMSCGHCASAVTEELAALTAVANVSVDVATGQVTVTSETALAQDSVRAAVDEAGYQLVS
jgi:copper chaperone CopZ